MVVVLLQRWQCWWLSVPHLGLFLLAALSCLHDLCGPVLIRGVVKKCADIVHKQRIEQLGDFLLVGEIQSPLKRDPMIGVSLHSTPASFRSHIPDAFQVHGSNLDYMTDFFALQDAISPSSCHACHIK